MPLRGVIIPLYIYKTREVIEKMGKHKDKNKRADTAGTASARREVEQAMQEALYHIEQEADRLAGRLRDAMTVGIKDGDELVDYKLVRLFDKDNKDVSGDNYSPELGHHWGITCLGVFLMLDYDPEFLFSTPLLSPETKRQIRSLQGVN